MSISVREKAGPVQATREISLTSVQAGCGTIEAMAITVIPDDELLAVADVVTIWVATPDAPTDMWSLTDAIVWVMGRKDRERISLFRPPDKNVRAAWVTPEQIERLALSLLPDDLVSAA
jgi:hypothetical protein